jgi:hypothetical protein
VHAHSPVLGAVSCQPDCKQRECAHSNEHETRNADGTTYDPPKPSKEISLHANEIKANSSETGSKEITSGLPELEMGNPKSKRLALRHVPRFNARMPELSVQPIFRFSADSLPLFGTTS